MPPFCDRFYDALHDAGDNILQDTIVYQEGTFRHDVPSSPLRDTVDDIRTHIRDLQGSFQILRSWLGKYRKIEDLQLIEHFRVRLEKEVNTFQTGQLHKPPLWLVIASLYDLRLEFDSVEDEEMRILVNCLDESVDRVLQQPCEPDDHDQTYVFPRCSREGVTAASMDKDFLFWLSGLAGAKVLIPGELQMKCNTFVKQVGRKKTAKAISRQAVSRFVVDLDNGKDDMDVTAAIKLIRHCTGSKKSLHDVDDYFDSNEEAPLENRELEALKIGLRRALVAPPGAKWWDNSMMARAILIGISQIAADGNMTALQYVLKSAIKLHSQVLDGSFSIDDGHLFGWTMLPVRLFGTHISLLKGDSRTLAELETRMLQVQYRCIPQFLLQVTRLDGIVTSQIDMARSLQTNILAAFCGIILIVGNVVVELYVKSWVGSHLHWDAD